MRNTLQLGIRWRKVKKDTSKWDGYYGCHVAAYKCLRRNPIVNGLQLKPVFIATGFVKSKVGPY